MVKSFKKTPRDAGWVHYRVSPVWKHHGSKSGPSNLGLSRVLGAFGGLGDTNTRQTSQSVSMWLDSSSLLMQRWRCSLSQTKCSTKHRPPCFLISGTFQALAQNYKFASEMDLKSDFHICCAKKLLNILQAISLERNWPCFPHQGQ